MIRVTVSAGVAAYPDVEVESPPDLVRQADEALYQPKDSGRNLVRADLPAPAREGRRHNPPVWSREDGCL